MKGLYKSFFLTVAAMLMLCMYACKKEYKQELKPYTDISRFVVSGYGELDSINAVISGNKINVYWNPDIELPSTVKPAIEISSGATILPASGQEVAFSENTVYTVTAEDGTTKQYQLKIILNEAIPSIYSVADYYSWAATSPLSIVGQYFMLDGDASKIRVYAQRVSDGFEFDLTVDTQNTTTTNISVTLPKFTAELDTGMHRLYVQIGEFKSNYEEIFLMTPGLSVINNATSLVSYGDLKFGEELVYQVDIKEDWKELYKKYYTPNNITMFRLTLQPIVPGVTTTTIYVEVDKSLITLTDDGKIKVKLTSDFFAQYANYKINVLLMQFGFIDPLSGYVSNYTALSFSTPSPFLRTILEPIIEETNYATLSFSHEGKTINTGESMTLDFTYQNSEHAATYASNLSALALGLLNESTGVYSVYTVTAANRSISGNRITFNIPTTATTAKNRKVVMIGATFYNGANTAATIRPRKILTNTSIAE